MTKSDYSRIGGEYYRKAIGYFGGLWDKIAESGKHERHHVPRVIVDRNLSFEELDIATKSAGYGLARLIEETLNTPTGWVFLPHIALGLESDKFGVENDKSMFRFYGEQAEKGVIYDLIVSKKGIDVFDASDYSRPLLPDKKDLLIKGFIDYMMKSKEAEEVRKKRLTIPQLNQSNSQMEKYLALHNTQPQNKKVPVDFL